MLQNLKLIPRVAREAGLTAERLQEAMQPAAAALQRRAPSWVFLGPPGVGKGTYASRVAEALGIAHVSAGDLVRHEMKQQTELGRKVGWKADLHAVPSCQKPLSCNAGCGLVYFNFQA
jgi:adenylate kinase